MSRPRATQQQKDAVRAKIRKAAVDLYREQGLANLTARAIAVRAEVSVGTIYAHFGSLPELARSLWQGPVNRFEQALEAKAAQQPAPLPRLRIILAAYLEFARDNPELYRGAFLFVRPPNDAGPDKQPLTTSVFAKLLIDTLIDGQQTGVVVTDDAALQAQRLWAALHGSVALPINLDRFDWPAVNDNQVVDGLMRMVSS